MISRRLLRYGLTGALSLLTHLAVLLILVEGFGRPPVLSSALGFVASFFVSFGLQHHWVFEHAQPMTRTLPRFLAVTGFGLLLNTSIMALGTQLLGLHYLLVQAVAFAAVPISNYLLNRAWTFHDRRHPEQAATPVMPTLDRLIISVITLAFLAMGFNAVLHLDLARDLATSFDMLEQGRPLLIGPQLAGVFNLGPAWYYLLAAFQSLGLGVAGIMVGLGLLAAPRFYLAYRAGQAWDGRRTGLLWAALLLLPGWHGFEQIFITHPILTSTLLAATALCGIRYALAGRAGDLWLMALAYSLALHAHPSSLVVVLLPIGLGLLGWRRHRSELRVLALAVLLAALPFLPYFIHQQLEGWPVLAGLGEFSSGQGGQWSLANLFALIKALFGGGLAYWLSSVAGAPSGLGSLLGALVAAICLLGLSGALVALRRGDRIAAILILTLITGLLVLPLLRVVHPYYMLTPIWVVLSALIARGLSLWSRHFALGPQLLAALVLGIVVLHSSLALRTHQQLREGSLPFALHPLMDVKQPPSIHRAHAFLDAAATRRSGRWLCRFPGTTLHGSYALSLLHSYAMEARLDCGELANDLRGSDEPGPHLVGLPEALLTSVDREALTEIGPFRLFPVRALPRAQSPVELEGFRAYPPLSPAFEPEETEVLALDHADGQLLAISHLGFALSRRPDIELRCENQRIEPLAVDDVSWLYRLPACPSLLELRLSVSSPDHLDVVLF
ncbi:GtrA family protein [Wenzhouxiangella marina]|uniref:Membrane protein n=1 Tax=Wenzhouxiangella marina TaxID=1579979 RepID=A0A0K0XZE0_9GAMM|nr:GtrA family protein [Wenzhouxiangella marina]AKS43002.1 membrane protein [Wenzhouxiangella marina]MBB6087315.1 putative flippase GtrA [Wenzhouxiangella marina]